MLSKYQLQIAHAVCGALGTLLFLPIGILIPRISRGLTTHRWWFPAHSIVNGLLGFAFITAAFGIAVANFDVDGGISSTTHRQLGVTLFALMFAQIGLGIFTHWVKARQGFHFNGRGPTNFLHMILGLVTVAIGWATTYEGLTSEWTLWGVRGPSAPGYKTGWAVIVAVESAIYLGCLALLPRQLNMESASRAAKGGQGLEANGAKETR
ncbi:MAG: hypothetical protein TREMPRED_002264 [Tremellales sp. Tagirdzhanova-0007]|nr:MAG: hypothetical protein TREMPRED_002264 [Tremellales sp. Tagirdzhanova-0007]